MQSLLAKLAAVALIGAGFAATGDLRRLAERAARFLDATAVPGGQPDTVAGSQAPAPQHPAAPTAAPGETPAPAAASAVSPPPADHRDAPLGRPVDSHRLPTSTLDTVDLRTLAVGSRVMVWIGTPPAAVAFDVVDPAVAEVLEQSVSPAGGGPQAVSRRLRLEGALGMPTRIDRGGKLHLIPLGVAYGGRPAGPTETLGPVRAIEVR